MKYALLIFSFIILRTVSFSQSDTSNNHIVFNSGCLEIPPKYCGGKEAMVKLFAIKLTIQKIITTYY
jgi:hypothetical protein